MRADEALRGAVHRDRVERPRDVPDVTALEHRRRAPHEDTIAIVPADRRMARVESVGDRLGKEDRHRLWPKMRVEPVAQLVARPFALKIEMRDLAERVHAGVGAPGAAERRRFAGQTVERLLDRLLHRAPVRLALPADERSAVILDGQLEARHRRKER